MQVTVEHNLYGHKTQSVFSGEEVPLPRWVDYPAIALSTGERQFPVRIIASENIIKINDNVVEQKFVAEPVTKRTIKVQGSKGSTYLVTINGKYKSCTCAGYQFRKSCKHTVGVE